MAKKEPVPAYDGYNHEFVGEVADDLYCQICTKIIRNAHLAVCCSQHFCESCLNKWTRQFEGKESCPHCHKEGKDFQHVIDRSTIRKINQLKIKCSNHGEGCKWMGELCELKTHLDSEKGCGYVIIACSNKCQSGCIKKRAHKTSEVRVISSTISVWILWSRRHLSKNYWQNCCWASQSGLWLSRTL